MLETHVNGLVTEVRKLRSENHRVSKQYADVTASYQAIQEERQALKAALAHEQQLKNEVLERVDALLERLKDLDTEA